MENCDQKPDVSCVSVRPKVRVAKTLENEELSGESVDKKCIRIVDADGNQHSFPALHQRFAECLVYVKYYSPPKNANGTLVDAESKEMYDWLEMVYTFEHNLRTILRLPFHRFWATVIHEKGFHLMLESYLLNAPRFYDSLSLLFTDQMKESINEIHKLVFKVHLRMSNFKESKKEHLTPQVFGQIIYDHYVFDVPKLMDLCTLYGNTNQLMREKLCKMIETIFKHQKAYIDDLQSSVLSLMSNLQHMQQDFEAAYSEVPLSATKAPKLKSMKLSDLQDTIYFITDLAVTLSTFVFIYAPAAKMLHKHKFENLIVGFYENVFPVLKDELESRFDRNIAARQVSLEIVRQLTICRHYFIKCFRDITVVSCFHSLFDISVDVNTKSLLIDDYLEVIGVAMSDKCFAQDYFTRYPFLVDLSALMEHAELTGFRNVDQRRIDYLLNTTNCHQISVTNNVNENGPSSQSNGDADVNCSGAVGIKPDIAPFDGRQQGTVVDRCDTKPVEFEDQDTIDKAALESCITNITDIFPDLGQGFIEACLEFYNNDVEKVVDALLTDSLPESIDKLDRTLRSKPKKEPTKESDNKKFKSIPCVPLSNNPENWWMVNPVKKMQSAVASVSDQKKSQSLRSEKEVNCDLYVPNPSVCVKPSNSLPDMDAKTKAYVKLAAIRIANENEYDDEYDDTYDITDPKVVDSDYKLSSEKEEKRYNQRK